MCRVCLNSFTEEATILETEFVFLDDSSCALEPDLFVGSGILCESSSGRFGPFLCLTQVATHAWESMATSGCVMWVENGSPKMNTFLSG